jgi:hypothetical protein
MDTFQFVATVKQKDLRINQLEAAIKKLLTSYECTKSLRDLGNNPALAHLEYELDHPKQLQS